MSIRWADAVVIARQVREGRVDSYAVAALKLANYILDEQDQIDSAMAEVRCPFPEEEADTSPEVPAAKHHTLPYPIQEEEWGETTIVDRFDELNGPKTGVLNAPQTGVKAAEVLPIRHNRVDGKNR